jgi:hypothetical protein
MNKIFNYYVEAFHRDVDLPYILQSQCFETKKQAIKFGQSFLKKLDFYDDDLCFRLMAFYGDEENYDIIELGYFSSTTKYIETMKEEE